MKEIQLSPDVNYYREVMHLLNENSIKHTYFSGKNVIAFINDEDASMFMLQHGGNMRSAIEEFKKTFSRPIVK